MNWFTCITKFSAFQGGKSKPKQMPPPPLSPWKKHWDVNKCHKRALLLKSCYTNWKYKMESTITIISWHKLCGWESSRKLWCRFRSTDCQICPNNYTCTCLDSILHTTVCKHVHLVHMNYMQKDTDSISEPTVLADTYFTSLLSDKKPDTSLTQTKTTLLQKLLKLEALVTNCQNTVLFRLLIDMFRLLSL